MVPCQGCSSENLVLNVFKTKHTEQQSNIVMIRFIAAQIVFESDARMGMIYVNVDLPSSSKFSVVILQ